MDNSQLFQSLGSAPLGSPTTSAGPTGGTNNQALFSQLGGQPLGQTSQPQGNNFAQDLIDDPLKTLLIQPAVRAYQAGKALMGDQTAGTQDVNINAPVLGHINIPAQKTGMAGAEQIGGDALKTGAYLAPGLSEGSIAAQAGKNALAGAAFGAGQSMQEGGSLQDVATQAGIGGATGGLVGGAIPLAGKALDSITKALPEALYNKALKPTLDELQKSMKYDDFQTLNQQLLDKGISGSPEKLLQLAQQGLKTNEDALQSLLSGVDGKITRDSLSTYLEPLVEKIANTPGMEDTFSQIHGMLNQVPKELSISDANVIKRNLYDQLNDTAFKMDANLSTKRQAMKTLAKGLKNEIEKASGDIMVPMGGQLARVNPVTALNQNLGVFGKLQDRTLKVLAQEARKSGLSLTDLMTLGTGFASGHGMLGIGADALKKTADSPSILTKTAVGLKNLQQKSLPKISLSGLKKGAMASAVLASSTQNK